MPRKPIGDAAMNDKERSIRKRKRQAERQRAKDDAITRVLTQAMTIHEARKILTAVMEG